MGTVRHYDAWSTGIGCTAPEIALSSPRVVCNRANKAGVGCDVAVYFQMMFRQRVPWFLLESSNSFVLT